MSHKLYVLGIESNPRISCFVYILSKDWFSFLIKTNGLHHFINIGAVSVLNAWQRDQHQHSCLC